MEMSENSSSSSNPLYKHGLAATANQTQLQGEPGGTTATPAQPTEETVSSTEKRAKKPADKSNAPVEESPSGDGSPA